MVWKNFIFILCMTSTLGASIVWGNDARGFAGASIAPSLAYDFGSNNLGEGFEVTAYALFVNVGASYRHWNKDLFDNENSSYENELRMYLGLGLLNILQVQGGFSMGNKTTMRIQSILPWSFFSKNGDPMDLVVHEPNLTITPYFETDFNDRKIFGLCVGILFI